MRKKYTLLTTVVTIFFSLFFEGNLLPGKSSQPHKPEKMFSSLAINNEDRLEYKKCCPDLNFYFFFIFSLQK